MTPNGVDFSFFLSAACDHSIHNYTQPLQRTTEFDEFGACMMSRYLLLQSDLSQHICVPDKYQQAQGLT